MQYYLRVFALLAIAWLSCATLCAQPESVPATEGSPPAEESNGADGSRLFASDREYDRLFLALNKAIERQDWPVVCERLLQLQAESPELLTTLHKVMASVPVAASHLLESLPPAGKAAYRRLADDAAEASLRQALSQNDLNAVVDVARHYRGTPAATRALSLLTQSLIDRGEWEEACLMIARHPALGELPAAAHVQKSFGARQNEFTSGDAGPAFLKQSFPSQIPAWESGSELPVPVRDSLNSTYDELRQSGIAPYLSLSLTPIPQGLICCGAAQRLSLDLQTGKVLWRRPIPGYGASWVLNPGDLSDANRRRMFSISVARRVFDESVTSRTQTDGERLFFTETIPADDEIAKPVTEEETPFPANRLVCASAATGETQWVFNGEPPGDLYLAGPPAMFGNRLYALGESDADGSLKLMTLDAANGKLLRSLDLAVPEITLAGQGKQSGKAVSIVVQDGHILCGTAAGSLLAVDPLLGEVSWAIRLPRSISSTLQPDRFDMQVKGSGFESWDSWQDVQLISAGEHLIFAPPASDSLHVVQRKTGRLIWQWPRGQAVFLAGVADNSIVVLIEKVRARGMHLTTGQEVWNRPIPQPAGRGILADGDYVYPILERDAARLNLQTGQVSYSFQAQVRLPEPNSVLPSRIRPRQFLAVGGELFEQSLAGVKKLQSPEQARHQFQLTTPEERLVSQMEQGEWRAAAAELRQQIQRAETLQPAAIRAALRSLLTEAYVREQIPQGERPLHNEIFELSTSPLERAAWRQLQAADALREHNWTEFASLWFSATQEELETNLPAPDDDRRCRLDRWFQAAVLNASQELPPAQAEQLDHAVRDRIAAVLQNDVQARSHLHAVLGSSRWGREVAVNYSESAAAGDNWIQSQLQWLELASGDDSQLSRRAALCLMRAYVDNKQWVDAQRWHTFLKMLPGEPQGQDQEQFHQATQQCEPAIAAGLLADAASLPWPDRAPRLELKTSNSKEVYLLPLLVHSPTGGPFSRMNVDMDFPAHQALRFHSGQWPRRWFQEIPRSPMNRNLRHEVGLDHVWGMEQVCILQSGSEVFAFTPFGKNGTRRSRQLWPPRNASIDTLGSRENLKLSFTWIASPRRPGFETVPGRRLDEFEHCATAVGPVRPGYFCIQQLGMLIAFDTSSGSERWRRYDLPKQALVFGDDHEVAVMAPLNQQLTRYSAVDGRELARHPWDITPEQVLQAEGLQLLCVHGDRLEEQFAEASEESESPSPEQVSEEPALPVILELRDARHAAPVWKREWAPGTLPFEVDRQWIGLLSPQGNLEFVSIKDGQTVQKHLLTLPERIDRIVCSVGEHDFLVVFSEPQTSDADPPEVPQGGYRYPFVRGSICAFDRQQGQLRWQQQLEEAVFPLVQPVDLPVWVTIASPPPARLEPSVEAEADEEGHPDELPDPEYELQPAGVTLRCYDRRSGTVLATLPGEKVHYSLTGDRERERVTLNTLKSRLEFDFSVDVEEPESQPEAATPAEQPPAP